MKETSIGMIAQSLKAAEIAVHRVQAKTMKCEEASMEAQKAFDKAKVHILTKEILHQWARIR